MSNDNSKGDIPIGNRETQRFDDVSNLLAQALTAIRAGEQQRAMSTLSAANNRLGQPRWPPEHPAGTALNWTAKAIDAAMVDSEQKRESAAFAIRQALQLLDATRHFEGQEVEELLTDGGERVVQACPHCDSPDVVRRLDLEQSRALWYCDSCFEPVEKPIEREPHSSGGPVLSRQLEQTDPSAVGGDD